MTLDELTARYYALCSEPRTPENQAAIEETNAAMEKITDPVDQLFYEHCIFLTHEQRDYLREKLDDCDAID